MCTCGGAIKVELTKSRTSKQKLIVIHKNISELISSWLGLEENLGSILAQSLAAEWDIWADGGRSCFAHHEQSIRSTSHCQRWAPSYQGTKAKFSFLFQSCWQDWVDSVSKPACVEQSKTTSWGSAAPHSSCAETSRWCKYPGAGSLLTGGINRVCPGSFCKWKPWIWANSACHC